MRPPPSRVGRKRSATKLVNRHCSQQIGIVHAALRDFDYLFRYEACGRVMSAVYKAEFVARAVERQRHLVDRLGVKHASGKKPSDRHDTIPTEVVPTKRWADSCG